MRGKELKRILEKNGWVEKRIHGSHHFMVKGNKGVSVPIHNKELGIGIVNKILKQTGLKIERN